MEPLYKQKPKLDVFKPRQALLQLHTDLFNIHFRIDQFSAYYPSQLSNLEKLTLILEDRRFLSHHGFDVKSALREIFRAMSFQKHGGASTIDMQFVRTCTGYRERTLSRKLYEILLSILIQFRYSKIVILRSYLNCAFYGSGLNGADAASKKIFQKHKDQLSVSESSFLAAMLVYPRPLEPTPQWLSKVERRARYGERCYITNKQRFEKLPV